MSLTFVNGAFRLKGVQTVRYEAPVVPQTVVEVAPAPVVVEVPTAAPEPVVVEVAPEPVAVEVPTVASEPEAEVVEIPVSEVEAPTEVSETSA